jgi:4-hydroxy-tetrahydrodipicolinate synthase
MARFGRVLTAMVTPFAPNGELDLAEAQRLARHLVEHGSEGLVVAGSTGEGATLKDHERIELFRAVVESVGGEAKVVCGTGTYSTGHSVDLTREAEKVGADGALVVTPYYNKPPQDALIDHFATVADSSNLPVMLYDIPGRTALKIEVDTIVAAAAHPNIVAVKDSCTSISQSTLLAARKPDGFEIYSGNDDECLAYQAIGAVGVVSVQSHVMGDLIREQFDAFEAGNLDRAREIQFLVRRLHPALLHANPVSIKAALNMLGFNVGVPRPPLREANTDEKARITEALQELGAL